MGKYIYAKERGGEWERGRERERERELERVVFAYSIPLLSIFLLVTTNGRS